MAHPKISTGLFIPPQPPLELVHQFIWVARLLGLDSVTVWDHFQDFAPRALWTRELTWLPSRRQSPHAYYKFQTLLGHLASRMGESYRLKDKRLGPSPEPRATAT